MNTRYRYYLDGTLYSDPIGWDGWKTDLVRDDGLRGIVEREQGKVTFTGDAYAYILSRREEGFCASVTVIIEEDCSRSNNFIESFDGNIFLSDVEFDITNCSCDCELVDNSYFARINNNRQIECSIGAGKSKNGEDIFIPDLWDIQMFNPCDGVDSNLPKPKAYRAHDVAKYIIKFMSDDQMEFQSTALDLGGEFEGVFLTKGLLMTDPSTDDKGVIFKWEDFLRNICNLCNLSWRVKKISGVWTFILEKTDDTFTNSVSANFSNVSRIIRAIDTTRNYAAVELGTDDVIDSLGCGVLGGAEPAFPDQINLLGPKREQFAVTGTCNIDSILDLTSDWVVSSNVIENIYFNGDTGYESDIILIHSDTLDADNLTAEAIKGDVFGTSPPVFYNIAFYNDKVVSRHLSGIPSSLVKYLLTAQTGFLASYTGSPTVPVPSVVVPITQERLVTPFPFDNDYTPPNYDLNNDYGNGTPQGSPVSQNNSCYVAPELNTYKFRCVFNLQAINNPMPLPANEVTVTFQRRDSFNVLIEERDVPFTLAIGPQVRVTADSPYIFMNAGDKLFINLLRSYNVYVYNVNAQGERCTFELIGTGTTGGVYEVYNPKDYIADLFRFSVPMSMAEFRTIQQNITDEITADDGNNQVRGWIDTISYDRHTNLAEITLITDGR
jgi:hypothetical protein